MLPGEPQHHMAEGLDPLIYLTELPIYSLSCWQSRLPKRAACALPTGLWYLIRNRGKSLKWIIHEVIGPK